MINELMLAKKLVQLAELTLKLPKLINTSIEIERN